MMFPDDQVAELKKLCALTTRHNHETGDGFFVWGFENRSVADNFIQIVSKFSRLSFWLVGLSRQYAVQSEIPLLGYYVSPDKCFGNHMFRIDVVDDVGRLERMRALAHQLLQPHRCFVGMSVVLATIKIGEGTGRGVEDRGTQRTSDGLIHFCIHNEVAMACAAFPPSRNVHK